MLLAGIQGEFRLDPRLEHCGVTITSFGLSNQFRPTVYPLMVSRPMVIQRELLLGEPFVTLRTS
jgi:hypothetical protein